MKWLWRKVMDLLHFRPARPPVTPLHDVELAVLDQELAWAIEKHKAVSNAVIKRSLDMVDQSEQARQSLKAIFDRATIPGEASMEGAWELVSRGQKHDDHP